MRLKYLKLCILCLIAVLAGISIFLLRENSYFMAVKGQSMEPVLKRGQLIIIEEIPAGKIKKGDIIVFGVAPLAREKYNYPPMIAHRVIEIYEKQETIAFRTKGDNTGVDPFTVRATDVRGVVSRKIPFLGFILLFIQDRLGIMTITLILLVISVGLYSKEISEAKKKAGRVIFAPVLEEQQKTKQALHEFASAMTDYAKHLESHTKAMQGLAGAAEKLEEIVEKLNEKLK